MSAPAPTPSAAGVLFRSLKHRNYRLFFFGQGVSLVGTWMQMVAINWVVAHSMTSTQAQASFWLGVVNFAGRIPMFLLAPLAGVLVERWNRRRLLTVTQAAAAAQAAVLAVLTLVGWIDLWQLVALSLMLGLINTLDIPGRQSFVVQMVDRPEDLSNAIALNSSLVNGARIIGPAIAGLILAVTSAGACFAFNAISYVAVILSLLAMRLRPAEPAPRKRLWHELREGFGYAFGFRPIRAILLLLAVVSLMGASYQVLLPVFAEDVLHRGAITYGLLMAGAGLGALAATVRLAMMPNVRGLGRWIATAPAIFGTGLIGLSLSRTPWISIAVMPVVGFGMITQMASSNTVLQTIVDEDKRGRLMALYSMAFMGMVPLGSLLAGLLASWIGAPLTVGLSGGVCIIGSMVFSTQLPAIRREVRPIYVRKGIIVDESETA